MHLTGSSGEPTRMSTTAMDETRAITPPTSAELVVLAALAQSRPTGLDLCGLREVAVRDPRMTGVERFAEAVSDALLRCIAAGIIEVGRGGELEEPRYRLTERAWNLGLSA